MGHVTLGCSDSSRVRKPSHVASRVSVRRRLHALPLMRWRQRRRRQWRTRTYGPCIPWQRPQMRCRQLSLLPRCWRHTTATSAAAAAAVALPQRVVIGGRGRSRCVRRAGERRCGRHHPPKPRPGVARVVRAAAAAQAEMSQEPAGFGRCIRLSTSRSAAAAQGCGSVVEAGAVVPWTRAAGRSSPWILGTRAGRSLLAGLTSARTVGRILGSLAERCPLRNSRRRCRCCAVDERRAGC